MSLIRYFYAAQRLREDRTLNIINILLLFNRDSEVLFLLELNAMPPIVFRFHQQNKNLMNLPQAEIQSELLLGASSISPSAIDQSRSSYTSSYLLLPYWSLFMLQIKYI